MKKLDPRVIDILKHGSRDERLYICEKEPMYFAIYHFPEFFVYPIAPFHFDFVEDYKRLMAGEIDTEVDVAFRESAKTSWKKMLIVHAICYKKKKSILYDSYDKNNSESALYDVADWLQTKQSIIEDYGELLPMNKKEGDKKKIQRINKFITSNGILLQAFSTQQSVRGGIVKENRPDWIIFDDIETSKTKESRAIIKKIIDHFNEARTAMSGVGCMTVLGNLILDDGVIAHIIELYKKNKRASVHVIPVVRNGKPTWPGKYVLTNREANEINATIEDKMKRKISIEQKKEDLTPTVFEPEMMNNPGKSGDLFFERTIVEAAIKNARDPIEDNAGFKIWARFSPKARYGMGADTSEGIGSDSNASAIINFATTPNVLVAAYEDNNLAPNLFGAELKRQGGKYGFPFLVPEINNTGYATVGELINEPMYPNLYVREVVNKTTQKTQKEWGFKVTMGSKWQVLGEFKEAFESGELVIYDLGLLEEMKVFRKQDARLANRDKGATRHFDKLRAAAYAWHARKYSVAPAGSEENKKKFEVPGMNEPYKL